MLVLTRKVGERIRVDDRIVVTLVRVEKNRVRVGIEAPPHVMIIRDEIIDRDGPGGLSALVAAVRP